MIYSSEFHGIETFTSGIHEIKKGIEKGPLTLLVDMEVESVSSFISGKIGLGFMISISSLSFDVSLKWL
jgi:hypothetical protein